MFSLQNLRKRGLRTALAVVAILGSFGTAWAAKDQLVIGVTQYPSHLNPNHEAITSKDYILGFVFRQLLDEAGWKVGPDKIRVNAQGQRLSLDFGTTAGNKVRELVQQVLQSQWREVGVEVVIKNEPARTFFGETARKRTYGGLALYAWTSDPDEPPVRNLHSSSIPVESNNWAGNNIVAFSNAKFDATLDKILVELDAAERKKHWSELQKIYVEELPVLPLFFRVQPFALPKWLKGIEPTGSGVSTHWAEYWHAI